MTTILPTLFRLIIIIVVSFGLSLLFFSKKKDRVETSESILSAFIFAMIVRVFVLQSFIIPSPSMEKTLMIGDNLIGTKFNFLYRNPRRGEMVIFRSPSDPGKAFVKRLIGFPGDRILIENGKVWINGKPFTNPSNNKIYTNMIPHVIPYMQDNHLHYNTKYASYHRYFQGLGLKNQEFIVPEKSYFLLGDNTEQSSDSRYWGFIPEHLLYGRVSLIYFPLSHFRIIW